MITYNELKEKCTCWTGYKRKPGTKPCESGSCVKEAKDALGHGSEKHHVLAFGRMNPITSGHEAVVNKVHEVAKQHKATHGLVVSHSQDAKKNPLTGEQKVKHAKTAFPGTNVSSASKEAPTILHHAAAAHKAGATHLHVVAGSDRHEEMHNLLHKYNGKDSAHGHYNFKSITVHSSGERDPDSEGTTGISASKMREHAASGNKEAFHAGAPSKMTAKHKDAMYHDVRKGMGIHEETTPYWKKSSFNKRMSALAKQERLAREKKEKEQKPVKEETLEQKADREKQLKRFHDQMSQANGPQKETETELDNLEKEIMVGHIDDTNGLMHNVDPSVESHVRVGKIKQMSEKLEPNMGAGAYIHDFISSTNPMFNNKSKEERRKMAIGAYMAAKARLKEDNSHYDEAEEHLSKANDAEREGRMKDFHSHMADHHDSMSEWHDSKGRSASADKHAEKAEMHHEKSLTVKEGAMQPNGTDQIDTSTSAPTASTVKDTTMGKKVKGFKFFMGEIDQPVKEQAPVAPVPDRKYIKGTPEHKAYMATKKPRVGHPTNVKEEAEELDEKSDQARRNKTYKNLMAASKGARVNRELGMTPADTGHKNNQQMNKAIGRAVSRGEVHEADMGKTVNVDKVNHAGDKPHEEKWEPAPKKVSKLKKEETMKSYKEFLQSLEEKLIGKQHKLDKNKNGKLDADDFEKLRNEEVEELDEMEFDKSGRYVHKGTYGSSYNPKPGHEETPDDEKAEKKAAGRKAGQSTGSYKPRKTMSKLKSAGATYK